MLRISMRELMAFMLAGAMAIAWLASHRQLQAALVRERQAIEQAHSWEGHCKGREKEIDQINKQLADRGLEIRYTCGFIGSIPCVCEISPNQPVETLYPN